jgi:hypothetical protein
VQVAEAMVLKRSAVQDRRSEYSQLVDIVVPPDMTPVLDHNLNAR